MHAFVEKASYRVIVKSPLELLTHNRLDLAIKVLYLKSSIYNSGYPTSIYDAHIKAFNVGIYREAGNSEKINLDSFLASFKNTFSSISSNGFDPNLSLIPTSSDGSIINGAHRVASAIMLGLPVHCVALDAPKHIYDYGFFYNHGLKPSMIEAAATKFIELADNVFVALLWPCAQKYLHDVLNLIPNIIYKKSVSLSINGGRNLIWVVYRGCEWASEVSQNSVGVSTKLAACFDGGNVVTAIAFQADSLVAANAIKEKVRRQIGLGKHSIHTTDTKDESIAVAHALFNDNAVHFLNYGKPGKYQFTFRKLQSFTDALCKQGLPLDRFVIDSGIVLELYGLREASDIDYISSMGAELVKQDAADEHSDQLCFHGVSAEELVDNPDYHFVYRGMKFISLHQVQVMKGRRCDKKDVGDCLLMKGLTERRNLFVFYGRARQKYFFAKMKLMHFLFSFLRVTGLYGPVRYIYRKIV